MGRGQRCRTSVVLLHEVRKFGDSPNRRRRLLRVAQGVIVPLGLIGLLWVAMGRTDAIHPQEHRGLFLSALALSQLSLVLLAVRFQASLWTLGIDIPPLRSALIALQSLFYFFFVPMSAGT